MESPTNLKEGASVVAFRDKCHLKPMTNITRMVMDGQDARSFNEE